MANPATLPYHMMTLIEQGHTIADAAKMLGVNYSTARNALTKANQELNDRTAALLPMYQAISLQQIDKVMFRLMLEMDSQPVVDNDWMRNFEKVMKLRMEMLGMAGANQQVNIQINNTISSGDPLYHQAQAEMIEGEEVWYEDAGYDIPQLEENRAPIIAELEDIVDSGEV